MNSNTCTSRHLLQSLAVVTLLSIGMLPSPASARIFLSIGVPPIRFVVAAPGPVVIAPRPHWRCRRGWRGRRDCRWR